MRPAGLSSSTATLRCFGFRCWKSRNKYCSVLPVSRHRDEIKRNFPRKVSRQVRKEKYSAFQNTHQMQRFMGKISPDLFGQCLNPSLNPSARDQHPDALVLSVAGTAPARCCPCHAFPPLTETRLYPTVRSK